MPYLVLPAPAPSFDADCALYPPIRLYIYDINIEGAGCGSSLCQGEMQNLSMTPCPLNNKMVGVVDRLDLSGAPRASLNEPCPSYSYRLWA